MEPLGLAQLHWWLSLPWLLRNYCCINCHDTNLKLFLTYKFKLWFVCCYIQYIEKKYRIFWVSNEHSVVFFSTISEDTWKWSQSPISKSKIFIKAFLLCSRLNCTLFSKPTTFEMWYSAELEVLIFCVLFDCITKMFGQISFQLYWLLLTCKRTLTKLNVYFDSIDSINSDSFENYKLAHLYVMNRKSPYAKCKWLFWDSCHSSCTCVNLKINIGFYYERVIFISIGDFWFQKIKHEDR